LIFLQDKCIYLLDDIFASVDIDVAQHIYTHCINGLLKNKTRIICTHKSQFLLSADQVIIIDKGIMVNQGPPFEVLSDYDIKTMDLKYNEANSNTYLNVEDWAPTKKVPEVENDLSDKENQEVGMIAFSVYKQYWNSIGSLVGWLLFIAIVLMQVPINYMHIFI